MSLESKIDKYHSEITKIENEVLKNANNENLELQKNKLENWIPVIKSEKKNLTSYDEIRAYNECVRHIQKLIKTFEDKKIKVNESIDEYQIK